MEKSHKALKKDHLGITDKDHYDYTANLFDPLFTFTTNKQEEFFMCRPEGDDDTSVFSGTIIQNTYVNPNQKKNSTKIDGIRYAFKHIIRNYYSPRSKYGLLC